MTNKYKKSHESITRKGSALSKYQDVIVGKRSLATLAYFEWCMLLGTVPGALGLMLRKMFWPKLFGSCGKGVQFAKGIVLRHPNRIHLGDNTVISEFCILDARTELSDYVLTIGKDVILSSNVMISCKNGTVNIGDRVGVGAQTIIQSTNECPVAIGDDCMIGPRCYFVGGGNYNIDRLDIPMREQGIKDDTGMTVENDVWLGANVTVLDGVSIGRGSVIGAQSLVNKPIDEYSIAFGSPARAVRSRK